MAEVFDGKQLRDGSVADAKLVEDYIKADGTRAYTGANPQDMGGARIENLGAPTAPGHAARQQDVDDAVVGLYDHKGSYDAATNSPDLDVSPSGVKKADAYTVSVAGNFFTEAVEVGDVLIANQDDPTALTHWTRVNKNIDEATETTKGIVELAADGESAAGVVVQGNDSRMSDARTPTAHKATHEVGGSDVLTGSLDANARVTVRKNSGADVGTRRRLNLKEGANVTLTVVDDGTDEEVEVTIAAAATVKQMAAFDANDTIFPAGSGAAATSRNGHALIAFDNVTDESVVYEGVLSADYDSSKNLIVDLFYTTAAAPSGDVRWDVEIESLADVVTFLDTSTFAAPKSVTATPGADASGQGKVNKESILFTNAQADAVGAALPFRVRITRDADNAADTEGSDAQLLRVELRQ